MLLGWEKEALGLRGGSSMIGRKEALGMRGELWGMLPGWEEEALELGGRKFLDC